MSLLKIIENPKFILEKIAMWPNKYFTLVYSLRTLFSLCNVICVIACLTYNATFHIGNFVKLSESLYMLISFINGTVKATTVLGKGASLLKLLDMAQCKSFENGASSYGSIVEDLTKGYRKFERPYIAQVTWAIIANTLYAVIGTRSLPLEFPHFNSGPFHYPFYFFETLSVCIGAYMNLAVDLLSAGLLWIAVIQLRVLNRKLEDTRHNVENLDGFTFTEDSEEELTLGYLVECCKHYSDIENYVKRLQEVFSIVWFIQMFSSVVAICNSSISILMIKDFATAVALGVYIMTMTIELAIYCWFGNYLIVESSEVLHSCYLVPWHHHNSYKNPLFMLMERAKRPMKVCGLNFFTLSFNTFVGVLKLTYSYFTLLRNSTLI